MGAIPTNNPIAEYYDGDEGYPAWTDQIKWHQVIDMGTYSNGSNDFEKFENARDELYAQGGGVLYYPAGEYDFSDLPAKGPDGRGLMLKKGIVIRGATPTGDRTAADDGKLDLLTTFKFPFQTKAGGQVPKDWNIIGLMPSSAESLSDVHNVGVVWINVVGGTIWWGPDREWGETWETAKGWKSSLVKSSWSDRIPDGTHPLDPFTGSPTSGTELGIPQGRLVFGSRFSDSAVLNDAIDEGFGQDGFFMAKFGSRIGVYGSRVFVANNTLPPSAKNFIYHQTTNSQQSKTLLFDYGKTMGIDVNKTMLGAYGSDLGYYAQGVVVKDNWVWNHGHKGYEISGTWLTIQNNHNERVYLTETIPNLYGLNGTYELTLDGYKESQPGGSGSLSDNLSRAFDLSGQALWIDGNTFNNTGSHPGNDGEGILFQRHGGTELKSVAITHNTHIQGSGEPGYFGGYDIHNYGHLNAWNRTPGWIGTTKAQNNHLIDSAFIANKATRGVKTEAGGMRDIIITDPIDPVSAPINVTATIQPEQDSIKITWEDTTANEIGFRVERRIEGGTWTAIAYRPRQSLGTEYNEPAWVDFLAPPKRFLQYRVVAIQSDDSNLGASQPTEAIILEGRGQEAEGLGSRVILNEDFTNGDFESNNRPYWTFKGPGMDFRVPNHRKFNSALSNRIASGGSSYTDHAIFRIPNSITTHPSQLQQFGINKQDEIAIVRYTAFSDVAKDAREHIHVQIAMLQYDPTKGDPYLAYNHDLSFETETRFVSLSKHHPNRLQLTANVENQPSDHKAQRMAHYKEDMTPNHLDQEYTSVVLWRNLPGTGTTNIEQWGHNFMGDYNVGSEMVNQSTRNQNPNYSLFNSINIFLQRGQTKIDLIRNKVDINQAQIGISHLHVGITKKTDANLDYRTDVSDFIRWNTYRYQSMIPTMQTGDFNNDQAVDSADLDLLTSYLGQIHDPNFSDSQSVYTYNREKALNPTYLIPKGRGKDPIFTYNPQTGQLFLHTQGQALSAWIIKKQTATSIEPINGDNWWIEAVGDSQQWLDLDLTGFTSTEPTLIATFTPGLDLSDFGQIEVGFATGGGRLVNVAEYQPHLFYKKDIEGTEYIHVTPYPVSQDFQNTPWTQAQENEFIKRYNSVIEAQGNKTNYGGRYFEQEKRSYPRAMLSYIWGVANDNPNSIKEAKSFLQAPDFGGDNIAHLTENVDYFPSFTLKGQLPKYFYFGKFSQRLGLNYLDPDYAATQTSTMYQGADLWLDDSLGDPLWRPNPIYNAQKDPDSPDSKIRENWTATGRNSWVDIRNTDNLEAMRESAIFLLANETGNISNRDLYAQNYRNRVISNWQTGMREWDSTHYFDWTAAANLSLYDFASETGVSAQIKKAAKAALDQNFTAAALKYYRGGFTGPNLRSSSSHHPFGGAASFYYLYFGDSPISNPNPQLSNSIHAILSAYRPPQAVVALAQKNFERHIEILATKSPYPEDLTLKPSQPATPDIQFPHYFETTYYGNTYQLGTVAAPDSPTNYEAKRWNVTTFKLAADNSIRGVDFFSANTKSLEGASYKRLGDQIAQYQNKALWLRPNDGESFYFMAPDPIRGTGTIIQENGIWFFQLENTWIALRPINLTYHSQANGKRNKSEIQYTFKANDGTYIGFALEVGEQGNSNQPGVFSNFDNFKNQVISTSLDLSQISQGDVTLYGTDDSYLRMIHNPINDLPIVYRNSTQSYNFTSADHFALYRSINHKPTAEIINLAPGHNLSLGESVTIEVKAFDQGNRGPISMEWKRGSLSVLSGTAENPGWLFEEQVNEEVIWSEREAKPEDYLGRVKRVEFWLNDQLMAEDSDGTDGWNFNWNPMVSGDYKIQVRALDNDAQVGWSELLEVKVKDKIQIEEQGNTISLTLFGSLLLFVLMIQRSLR